MKWEALKGEGTQTLTDSCPGIEGDQFSATSWCASRDAVL